MSHTPHELAVEFPSHVGRMHDLKGSNAHFARLCDEYHEVNRAIHRAESRVDAVTEEHESTLRRQRLALKDQIATMLEA
ncbi:MAG: YdcH family protein [Lysobacteraceae bacterium]